MTRIALFGASGRMGQAIIRLIQEDSYLTLSQAIAHPRSSSMGKPAGQVFLSPSLNSEEIDLLLDVSLPKALGYSLEAALQRKKPLVLGVTGLEAPQMNQLKEAASIIPIFYSPNFSLGMAIFRKIALEAALCFHKDCTVDLFEAHHKEKKDAPSGSALAISNQLNAYGKKAQIHSIRSGKIIGEHSLLLNADEERLEISHTAHSRDVFARGALQAARFLLKKQAGLYGMDDLIVSSKA